MLSNIHYYHRTTRKLVSSFGSIFNNLKLVRYNQAGTVEIERVNVPITYASKEKFYKRITKDPDLKNPVQISLPRMAFEMTGMTYDPLRKLSSHIDHFDRTSITGLERVKMTPYNFDFNLYAFVRNTEDGLQIVEQILPYFTPDYTMTIDFLGFDDLKMDVPVVFNSVSYEDDYEGDPETTRSLIWTLNFSVKAYLFGPISEGRIIRKVTANVYDSTYDTKPLREFELSNGSGNFKINELAFQGTTLDTAFSAGFVREWISSTNTVILYDTTGTFDRDIELQGSVTNARWNISSMSLADTQLTNITVVPDPLTANVDDDFGFSTTVETWPNIT